MRGGSCPLGATAYPTVLPEATLLVQRGAQFIEVLLSTCCGSLMVNIYSYYVLTSVIQLPVISNTSLLIGLHIVMFARMFTATLFLMGNNKELLKSLSFKDWTEKFVVPTKPHQIISKHDKTKIMLIIFCFYGHYFLSVI